MSRSSSKQKMIVLLGQYEHTVKFYNLVPILFIGFDIFFLVILLEIL